MFSKRLSAKPLNLTGLTNDGPYSAHWHDQQIRSGFKAMQNSIKSLYHTQSFDFYILLQYLCVNLVLVEGARYTEALFKPKRRLGTAKVMEASRYAAEFSFRRRPRRAARGTSAQTDANPISLCSWAGGRGRAPWESGQRCPPALPLPASPGTAGAALGLILVNLL